MFRRKCVIERVVYVDYEQKEMIENGQFHCNGINDWDAFAYEDYAQHKIFVNGQLVFDNDNCHSKPETFYEGVYSAAFALDRKVIVKKYVSWENVGGYKFTAYN